MVKLAYATEGGSEYVFQDHVTGYLICFIYQQLIKRNGCFSYLTFGHVTQRQISLD